jgi:antitoxin MazE
MSVQVQAKIQKWGNGLGLRVSGILRDLPHLENGSLVNVRVTTKGFAIEKVVQNKKQVRPVYTEKELLKDLTPHTAHADLLPTLNPHEAGYE